MKVQSSPKQILNNDQHEVMINDKMLKHDILQFLCVNCYSLDAINISKTLYNIHTII